MFEVMFIFALTILAGMVKLVDMPDLGSGAARRVGSSPITRTEKISKALNVNDLEIFYFNIPRLFPDLLFFLLVHLISLNSINYNKND